MKPYYQDDFVTIYHGDCRELLPQIEADAVVSDPPYGMAWDGRVTTVEIGTWDTPPDVQNAAMGIDWMTVEELSEAIPPAYTEHIGGYLLAAINARAAA